MSRKFLLDTKIHLDAMRDSAFERGLDAFLERNAPAIFMSAVVMQELRAEAITDKQASALQDGIFSVFERRRRIAAPSVAAFKECGRILAALFRKDGVPFNKRPRSLAHDILIAATCREDGFILVTRDQDFAFVRPHLRGFTFLRHGQSEGSARRDYPAPLRQFLNRREDL